MNQCYKHKDLRSNAQNPLTNPDTVTPPLPTVIPVTVRWEAETRILLEAGVSKQGGAEI